MNFSTFTRDDDRSRQIEQELITKLTAHGYTLNPAQPAVVFFIGGDGTFLRAVDYYHSQLDTCQFVGIRTGNLGFFTDFEPNEVDLLVSLFTGLKQPRIVTRPLIALTINDGNTYYGLNEVRIENNIDTLAVDVYIDDIFLEHFRGNGLIVATPAGSTAYNRSLGGPIVDNHANLLILTEVAGIQHFTSRSVGASLVLAAERKITLISADLHTNVLGVDNRIIAEAHVRKLDITLSKRNVQLLRLRHQPFVERLQRTLIR